MSSRLAVPGTSPDIVVMPSATSGATPSPQPTNASTAAAAAPFPKRIALPADLDSFTLSAWSALCRDAGYEVLTSEEEMKKGYFILVLNEKYTLSTLTRAREQYGRLHVRFVSSVVFTASSRAAADGGPLGPFPSSLDRFRTLLSGALLCPTALSAPTKRLVQLWTESLGGAFDGTFTTKVTHLVAAKALSDKYRAAVRYARPIVTHEWAERCFRQGALLPTDRSEFQVGCMLGANVCAINLPPTMQSEAQRTVLAAGGAWTPLDAETAARLSTPSSPAAPAHARLPIFGVQPSLTHILAVTPVPAAVLDQAHAAGVPITSFAWLQTFVSTRGVRFDTADFPVRSAEDEEIERQAARERAQAAAEKEAARAAAAEEQRRAAEAETARAAADEQARLQAEQEQADRTAREDAARESARRAREEAARQVAAEEEKEEQARRAAEADRQAALEAARKELEVEYDPAHDDWLSGMVVILFALDSRAQEETLARVVRYGGGTRLTQLAGRENALHAQANANCSNMVLVYGSCRREALDDKLRVECSSRAVNVASLTMPVVNFRWLLECHRAKQLLPYGPFLAPPPSATPPTAADQAAATAAPAAASAARGSSPFQRTDTSVPGLTRTNSLGRAPMRYVTATKDDDTASRQATLLRANEEVGGATDFSAFNSQLPTHKSALPPPVPAATAAAASTAHVPALLKMATTSTTAGLASSKARLFAESTFCVEDGEDSDGEDGESKEERDASPLRILRFTHHKALTARKQLTDYGASSVLESRQVNSMQIKRDLAYVVGSVCGSHSTPTQFKSRYGSKAQFVSHLWVAACVKHERLLPLHPPNMCWNGTVPRSLCPAPTQAGKRAAAGKAHADAHAPIIGFSALRISGSGFSHEESELLGALVRHCGAEFTADFKRSNTHLIVNQTAPPRKETAPGKSKLSLAVQLQIPCVQPQWLLDCMKKREVCDTADYALPPEMMAAAVAAAAAGQSSRHSARHPTPGPDSPLPLAPDTPAVGVAVGAPAPAAAAPLPGASSYSNLEPPSPLPLSHFKPPRAAGNGKAAGAGVREGEIDSQLVADGEGEGEEEGDDFADGFARALRGANARVQVQAKPVSSPLVRSRRAQGKQRATTDASSVATAAAAASTAATSAPSAPASPNDAGAAKLSAKEAFRLRLKAGPQPTRRSTARQTAPTGDSDEGEAELEVPPLTTAAKPTATAAAPAVPSPVDEGADAMDLGSDTPAAAAVPVPVISPFKSVRKQPAGGSSADAAPAVVAPAAQGAPASANKKRFTKRLRATPPHTPQSTPPDAPVEPVAAVPSFRAAKGASAAKPAAAAPAAAAVVTPDSAASRPKRARRRILEEEEEANESEQDAVPDEPNEPEAVPAKATAAAAEESEAEDMDATATDDEQPGSQRKPAPPKAKGKAAATATAASSKAQRTPRNRKQKRVESSDEDEYLPAAATSHNKGSKKRPSTPTSSGSPDDSDDEWMVEPAAAAETEAEAAIAPPKGRSSTRSRKKEESKVSTPVTPVTPAPSFRAARASRKRATPVKEDEEAEEQNAETVEAPSAPQKSKSKRLRAAPARSTLAAAEPKPVVTVTPPPPSKANEPLASAGALQAAPVSPVTPSSPAPTTPVPASTLARFAKRTPPPSSSTAAPRSPAPTSVPLSKRLARQPVETEDSQSDDPFAFSDAKASNQTAAVTPRTKASVAPSDDETTPAAAAAPPAEAAPASGTSTRAKRGAKAKAATVEEESIAEDVPMETDEQEAAAAEPAAAPTPSRARGGKAAKATKSSKRQRDVTPSPPPPPPAVFAAAAAPLSPSSSPLQRSLSTRAALSLSVLKSDSQSVDAESAASSASSAKQARGGKKAKRQPEPEPEPEEPAAATDTDGDADGAASVERSSRKKRRKVTGAASTSSTPMETGSQESEFLPEAPTKKTSKKAAGKEKTPRGAARTSAAAAAAAATHDDDDVNEAEPVSVPRARLLTLSGVSSASKPEYAKSIEKLGGTLVDDSAIDYATLTHIILAPSDAGVLKRSEKVLVGLCTGARMLRPEYLKASERAGRWLDESKHEWAEHASPADPLRPALRRWRAGASPPQPFAGWVVTLDVASGREALYRKLLAFGGGKVVERAAASAAATRGELTHVLVETEAKDPGEFKKSGGKLFTQAQRLVGQHTRPAHLLVVRADFVIDHLARLADARDFTLIESASGSGAASAASTPSRSASRAKAAPAAATEEQESDEPGAEPEPIDRSIRSRRALTSRR